MTNNKKQPEPIQSLLTELLETRDMSEQKLAHATDVPLRFIAALRQGEFEKLPARPYVYGYIKKIADAFAFDFATMWESFLISAGEQAPAKNDRLPENRFAKRTIQRGKAFFIIIVIALVAFFAYRFNDIIGTPNISLSLPNETFMTSTSPLTVTGVVDAGDKLALNGEIIYTDENGSFEKDVALTPGLNTIEFTIHRFLGREITVTRQVVYEEQVPLQETQPTEEVTNHVEESEPIIQGQEETGPQGE